MKEQEVEQYTEGTLSNPDTNNVLDNELDAIEQIISSNLESMIIVSENLDKIGESFYESVHETITEQYSDDKDMEKRAKAEAAALASAIAIKGVGEIYNAVKTQIVARELLNNKQKIASAKIDVINETIDKAEKNYSRIKKHVEILRENKFPIEQLTGDHLKHQEMMISGTLCMARRSIRNLIYLYFIQAEYNAWLEGEQESEAAKPSTETINGILVEELLFPTEKDAEKQSVDIIYEDLDKALKSNNHYAIKGNLLCLLLDKGLMAYYLSLLEQPNYIPDINTKSNAIILELLYTNELYPNMQHLNGIENKFATGTVGRIALFYINALLAGGLTATILLRFSRLSSGWEWCIGIAVGLIALFVAYKSSRKVRSIFEIKYDHFRLFSRNEYRKEAGYEPERQTMSKQCEKATKTILMAILGGILGFLFLPFPGGLLLGALVFAGIGGSIKWEDVESDGSDYVDIKLGKVWLSSLIFLTLAGFIIYLNWFF